MQLLYRFLDRCRKIVQRGALAIAKLLNSVSGGRLSPNAVTLFGFAMHLPIALLIARGYFIYAGLLLIVFGLFDTLDGQLARLQGRASNVGMFLDSVTDRMKEALLYVGIAYFFVWSGQPNMAVWAVAACGAGLLVSYINAWGEVVTKDIKNEHHQTNKVFRGGIMSFDVRMFAIIVGLLFNQLPVAIVVIAILAWVTALQRVRMVMQKLR